MRKNLFYAIAFVFFFSAFFTLPDEAIAVPEFARQTGLSCSSCHFQHFPAINAFGRAFKAGGYTQIGGQSLIEGDILSIPVVLNASLVTKVRYQKTNGDINDSGKNKGQLQFPDEGAFLIGGRAGEHVGFLLEAQLVDPDMSAFASYKMPIVFEVSGTKLSFIPFTTDAGGAPYGFELLNTGPLRMSRILEHRKETSAQQYIGTAESAAGFAFVASHPLGFVNYTMYSHDLGTTDAGPYLHYARIAVTPTIAGWDVGAGLQWWGGTTKESGGAIERHKANAWGLDLQLQGRAGNLPLGVYLTYGSAEKSSASEPANTFNSSAYDDKTAWTILAELGIIPNRFTVAAAYRGGKNGDPSNNGKDSDNAATLGATYLLAQNVEFQVNHSWYSGDAYDPKPASGDALTTLMIFAAF